MGTLIRVIKAAIGAALLNRAVKGAFVAAIMRLISWVMQPSTSSKIRAFISDLISPKQSRRGYKIPRTLLEGLLAFALIRSKKKGWIFEPAVISTALALIFSLLRSGARSNGKVQGPKKDYVLDFEEYTVVDEKT
ncbi:Uncharacterised protein [uncultured archaeon]|nr:Uncharacterised protein [uncultured archaeon]